MGGNVRQRGRKKETMQKETSVLQRESGAELTV